MEHLQSATMSVIVGRGVNSTTPSAALVTYRYNIVHHIGHLFVPKRCYFAGYRPFLWELPAPIDGIWFHEGFAQYAAAEANSLSLPPAERDAYMQSVLTVRFRGSLAEVGMSTVNNLPLAQLSLIASSQYAGDFRTGMGVFSRGGLMAAAVDAAMRNGTSGPRLREALRLVISEGRQPLDVPALLDAVRRSGGGNVSTIVTVWLAPYVT